MSFFRFSIELFQWQVILTMSFLHKIFYNNKFFRGQVCPPSRLFEQRVFPGMSFPDNLFFQGLVILASSYSDAEFINEFIQQDVLLGATANKFQLILKTFQVPQSLQLGSP